MINEETIEMDGRTYIKHYSDTYTLIQQETGIEYVSAIDVIPCPYTYVESTHPKPVEQKPAELEADSSLNIVEDAD